jgi:hypothetical protein
MDRAGKILPAQITNECGKIDEAGIEIVEPFDRGHDESPSSRLIRLIIILKFRPESNKAKVKTQTVEPQMTADLRG